MQLLNHVVARIVQTQLQQVRHPFIHRILHLHLDVLFPHQRPLPQYVVY